MKKISAATGKLTMFLPLEVKRSLIYIHNLDLMHKYKRIQSWLDLDLRGVGEEVNIAKNNTVTNS